jgi:hypothetical protein
MRETPPDTTGLASRYLIALGAAALVMPALVLGAGAPVWAGFVAAVIVFLVLGLFAATSRPTRAKVRPPQKGRRAVWEAVMADARPALDRVEAVIDALPRNAVRDRLDRIAEISQRVLKEVEAEPARLASAQRLFTYYLPRTAEIAEGYAELRRRGAGAPARLAAIEDVLAKTEAAAIRFANQVVDDDMRTLDAEIRLVEDALREDLK